MQFCVAMICVLALPTRQKLPTMAENHNECTKAYISVISNYIVMCKGSICKDMNVWLLQPWSHLISMHLFHIITVASYATKPL